MDCAPSFDDKTVVPSCQLPWVLTWVDKQAAPNITNQIGKYLLKNVTTQYISGDFQNDYRFGFTVVTLAFSLSARRAALAICLLYNLCKFAVANLVLISRTLGWFDLR
jgi:hypothetical protein